MNIMNKSVVGGALTCFCNLAIYTDIRGTSFLMQGGILEVQMVSAKYQIQEDLSDNGSYINVVVSVIMEKPN